VKETFVARNRTARSAVERTLRGGKMGVAAAQRWLCYSNFTGPKLAQDDGRQQLREANLHQPAFAPISALFVLAFALAFPAAHLARAQTNAPATMTADEAREENAYAIGLQAYLWGFPLQFYGRIEPRAVEVGGSYINDFRRYTALKTAADKFVVTPNNVTVDAYATLDLTAEPVVIFVPALREQRWYIVQIGDSFDEIARNIGGTKGPQSGVYVVTGPDYKGAVPGDMIEVKMRTKTGVVDLRVFAGGASDLSKAVAAQTGFALMPLSAYLRDGLAHRAAAERPQMALYNSAAPEDIRYFDELGDAMRKRLPASADSGDALVASFRQIGLGVGGGFEWRVLDDPTRRGLARAIKTGAQIVDSKWASTGQIVNGWKYTFAGGRAGYDPGLRAALAKYKIGAQLSDQVLYPNVSVDDKSEPLNGARKYVLHFDAGKLPPVSVFWNMAMYGSDMLFVENDFGRYSIGSTTDGLRKNPDGSLTIVIQKDRPADASNWLPAPAGDFNLTMRLYGPETSVLDGSYRLPPVKQVN
jgi:hypothetical protein